MVEQLADRDVRAAGYQAGQVLLHGVVQTDSVLADQLQDGGGDEHFGHAARPEAAVAAHGRAGRQVGHSRGASPDAAAVADLGDGGDRPGAGQRREGPLALPGGSPVALVGLVAPVVGPGRSGRVGSPGGGR